jgi:hypothetical protein
MESYEYPKLGEGVRLMTRPTLSTRARVNAAEMHKTPGEIMKRVMLGQETLILEREGYPVMVLLPYRTYEALSQEQIADEVLGPDESKSRPRKPRGKKVATNS